ncbi:MAG: hypothetical protein LBG52_08790 [Candidatus Peribacteria bacterium]|nr:hypothetical protein [Candidatus Peribacteria bacterium]
MKHKLDYTNLKEREPFHYPSPVFNQGKGSRNNELLGTLNNDGDREAQNVTTPDDILDTETRENDLLANIYADQEENYIPADEGDTEVKEIPLYYVRNKRAPRDAVPAVEDDLYAVMSSDDKIKKAA